MVVFTMGYEGLSADRFMLALAAHNIDTVVDVRELPLSRKPGFSKKALASSLSSAGREYVHMVDLGCPKPVRDDYRRDANWRRYTEGFQKHLKMQKPAISALSELVASSNCVLLCYEADFNYCHRSMVAQAVREYCGATIKHLSVPGVKKANPAGRQLACA